LLIIPGIGLSGFVLNGIKGFNVPNKKLTWGWEKIKFNASTWLEPVQRHANDTLNNILI